MKKIIFLLFIFLVNEGHCFSQIYPVTDASFGGNGRIVIPSGISHFRGTAIDLSIQSDNKIIILSREDDAFDKIVVFRYNNDGTPDTTFGQGDESIMGSNPVLKGYSLKLFTDDKYIVAGNNVYCGMILKYTSNGMADTTFNHSPEGWANFCDTEYKYKGNAFDALILPGDKIMVYGVENSSNLMTTDSGYVYLMRLNSVGTPDSTFGINGGVEFEKKILYTFINANKIIEQPDGKFLICGTKIIKSSPEPPGIGFCMRYNANGSLDSTFGVHGNIDLVDSLEIEDMKLQPDGKIIFAANKELRDSDYLDFNYNLMLMRVDSNGRVDSTFANNGVFTYHSPYNLQSVVHSVILQPDGKIICGGSCVNTVQRMLLVRILSNGIIDKTFGIEGTDTIFYSDGNGNSNPGMEGYILEFQSDGKLLFGGSTLQDQVFLTRFIVDSLTGVKDIGNNISLNIYPNPTRDRLRIEVLNNFTAKQIIITDVLGKTIEQLSSQSPFTPLDVHSFATGIYFVKVQISNGSVLVKKFVKE